MTRIRQHITPARLGRQHEAAEFGNAVRHLWYALTACVILIATIRLAYGHGDAWLVPHILVGALVSCLLTFDRVRSDTRIAEVLLAGAVAVVGTAMWLDGHRGDGILSTTGLVLFTWPALVSAYYLPLRRAMVTVSLIIAFVLVDLLTLGGGESGLLRAVTTVLVYGGTVPLVSLARLRTELSIKYLHEAAIRDALTGLFNRRGFEAELLTLTDASRQSGEPLAVLIADIDYFKSVNDRHGHAAGDQLLMEIGTLLHLHTPIDAVVGRIGGEEFAVVLPGVGFEQAFGVADEVRVAIGANFARSATKITLSMGVVASDRHGTGMHELLVQADQALYAAKTLGRNRSVGYSDDVLDVLERARIREEEASRNQLATLLTLAEALDLRDVSTARHSHAVADYAEGMAIEMGLPHDLVERIRLAGLLHDIGKIGVPDSVLLHPGKLDDEQWRLMQQHPEIGARMLNHVDYTDIRDWVLAHHERIDGRGYPHALQGDDIPLAARILAVADSYEAMTADRVYRAAPGHEFARGQLRDCSGSQFDPDVVAAMERYLDAAGIGVAQEDTADDDGYEMPLAA